MRRWRYDPAVGKMIPSDEWHEKYGFPSYPAPMVISDIAPYRSAVTGERIVGRRQHRDHLRDHGLVEVGNEKPRAHIPKPMPDPHEGLKNALEKVQGGYKPPPLPHRNPGPADLDAPE